MGLKLILNMNLLIFLIVKNVQSFRIIKLINSIQMNIKMYGADWCPDCINAKNFFDSRRIEYEYIICTNNDRSN